jgi:hypothetical protein
MVGVAGIEPALVPNLGHTVYKSVDASNYIIHPYKKVGAQGGTRTHRIYHLEIACMPIPSQAQKRSSDLGVLDDKS